LQQVFMCLFQAISEHMDDSNWLHRHPRRTLCLNSEMPYLRMTALLVSD
jgi:hypothetical protein